QTNIRPLTSDLRPLICTVPRGATGAELPLLKTSKNPGVFSKGCKRWCLFRIFASIELARTRPHGAQLHAAPTSTSGKNPVRQRSKKILSVNEAHRGLIPHDGGMI